MRLAFVNSTRKWGGVKTWTLELTRWLSGRKHDCLVAARPGDFADACQAAGLAVYETAFGPDLNPLAVARFAVLFREHATQLVVVNVGKDLRTAGVAARLLGLPVVMRLGAPGDLRPTAKVRLGHKLLRPAYLTPSRETRDAVLARLPFVDPADVTAIHTGKVPAAEPAAMPIPPYRLITTSRLSPDKGHAQLLETLAALASQGADFRLTVVGDGSEAETLKARARELGLAQRVAFTGFTTDVRSYLRAADVFVLPSFAEAMPNALLEAMAEGLAPVAHDVGGVAEIWPAELTGLLAPPGELQRPLEAILRADPQALHRWQLAAWSACRENFSLDTQDAKLEAYFAARIATGGGQP